MRYAGNPHVTCWHINNEFGNECYCGICQNAFRVWLKDRYKTIEAVNEAWNMEFWGHTLYDWDEIVLPNALGDGFSPDGTHFAEFPWITGVLFQTAIWTVISWSGTSSAAITRKR